jgi:hypothetical protein
MTCDQYYDNHQNPIEGLRDRCSIPAIESSTAKSVALLAFSTTLFGVPNLFLTGWTIKKYGVKTALCFQVSWVAIRLLVQNTGVEVGKGNGIIIVQCSQIITIVGGKYICLLFQTQTEVLHPRWIQRALSEMTSCISSYQLSTLYIISGIR